MVLGDSPATVAPNGAPAVVAPTAWKLHWSRLSRLWPSEVGVPEQFSCPVPPVPAVTSVFLTMVSAPPRYPSPPLVIPPAAAVLPLSVALVNVADPALAP